MSDAHISLPAADVNGQTWTKVLIQTSRKALEWMCEHQPRDGRGVQNGGVKSPLELKSDEINQSPLAMGAEVLHTTY